MEQRNIPNRHREGTGPATAPLSAPYLTPPTRVVACMAPNLESNPGWGLGILVKPNMPLVGPTFAALKSYSCEHQLIASSF